MKREARTGATRASCVGVVADRAWQRLQIDRFAGGRQRAYVIREDMRQHPRTVLAFQRLRWLLVALTVVSTGAVVIAVALSDSGHVVPLAVWVRCAAVLGITLTLYVFAWRAQLGWWWAYSRLRLFSRIFPVVTLVVASIPGLYPAWMVLEQIVFSFLLVGISAVLSSRHMREAFPKPEASAAAGAGPEPAPH
ncbi:hypothetical protein [Frigoribacterium salinisoli]